MRDKLKKVCSILYDTKLDGKYYIFIIIIIYELSRIMKNEMKVFLVIMEIGSVVCILGFIYNILRKDRSKQGMLGYGLGSVFVIFLTYMIFLANKAEQSNDINMTLVVIKIALTGITLGIDGVGVTILLDSTKSKGKKIKTAIGMIYGTSIAIVAIIFLPTN